MSWRRLLGRLTVTTLVTVAVSTTALVAVAAPDTSRPTSDVPDCAVTAPLPPAPAGSTAPAGRATPAGGSLAVSIPAVTFIDLRSAPGRVWTNTGLAPSATDRFIVLHPGSWTRADAHQIRRALTCRP
jgi:hypothetical protein